MNTTVIGLYIFEGPFAAEQLRSEPGICAVVEEVDGEFELLDLLPSTNVKRTFDTSEWRFKQSNTPGTILAAAYYMPGLSAAERQRVVDEIEQEFDMVEALAS